MKNKKISFNASVSQFILIVGFVLSIIGVTIAATTTVVSYTNGTASRLKELDRKIDSKIDSTHHKMDKLNDKFNTVIGFFEQKNELLKYMACVEASKKSIKDTIVYPKDKKRMANKDCYTLRSDVDIEDNYINSIEGK